MIILEQLLNWFASIGARPLDLLFIGILYVVRRNDVGKIRWLRAKYELLNTGFSNHAWIIHLRLGVKSIKKHRSGDIELVSAIDEIESE
jgi:hypothetical protein